MGQQAVFLDRDGVLIRDVHLLTNRQQVRLFDYVPEAIMALKTSGFITVVVSNQPVVARGLISEQEVIEINLWIQQLLQAAGKVQIDKFYFCPHHPNANLPEYRKNCGCRKPQPGMLLNASQELGIDLSKSYMVGDRISDIVAGHRAGCRTILVETGMHQAPPIESSFEYDSSIEPDYICESLFAAAQIIIEADR